MEQNIMEIRKMINKRDMDNKNGKMGHYIEVTIYKVKSKGKEFLYGVMIVRMKENFGKTIYMAKVSIPGKMEEFIKETGRTIKWMEKDFLHGLMEENMKVST